MKAVILALLLVQSGAAAVLSVGSIDSSNFGVGANFVTWAEVQDGNSNVHAFLNDQDVLLSTDGAFDVGHLGPAADGTVAAWSRRAVASAVGGEAGQRVTNDLIVYDMKSRAIVYQGVDAGLEDGDISVGNRMVAYTRTNDVGDVRVHVIDLGGQNAFTSRPLVPGLDEPQFDPTTDGERVAFLTRAGSNIGLILVEGSVFSFVVEPVEGNHARSPDLSGDWLTWHSYVSGRSSIQFLDLESNARTELVAPEGELYRYPHVDKNGYIFERTILGDGQSREIWGGCHNEAPRLLIRDGFAAELDHDLAVALIPSGDEVALVAVDLGCEAGEHPVLRAFSEKESPGFSSLAMIVLVGTIAHLSRYGIGRRD